MGGNDGEGGANSDVMQRLQSSFATSSSSLPKQQQITLNQLDIPQVNNSQFRNQIRQLSPNVESNKRVGIPPSHPQMPPISPYSGLSAHRTINQQLSLPNFVSPNVGPVSHSRSLSQPLFFSNDSLPPLGSFQYRDSPNSISDFISNDVSMEDRDGNGNNNSHTLLPYMMCNNSLPPRKAHRRSNSDIPFGFSNFTPSLPPQGNPLIKRETSWENNAEGSGERKSEGEEIVDDLFSAYMNLDNIEPLNSSENLSREDMDSRASGTKTNGGDSSDNEASSSVNDNSIPRSAKRNAGEDIAPTTRHYRSVSMDSFMDKINFEEESAKLLPVNSIDGNSNPFSLEFGNGEFSGADLKKIMSNEKLAEIALSDPKKAKRILANRQSAARSKERKTRYIVELEHKVQTLQTEATTLSAQLTLLQRDSTGLSNQNNELKFRLQAMEQQAHLRDALNEALTGEVHRLKLATAELSGGDHSKFQQLSINSQMFQMHHQVAQLNHHYMQQKQSQPQAQAQAQAQAQVNGNSTQTNDSIK